MRSTESIRSYWGRQPSTHDKACNDVLWLLDESERLMEALRELLDAYEDACHQGSGNEPLSSPTWHNFMSTWEQADELIPRIRHLLWKAGR